MQAVATTPKTPSGDASPSPAHSRPRSFDRRKLIVLLVAFVLSGIALYSWHVHLHQEAEKLLLYGNIDIREVNLGFRVAGKLDALLKEEGDRVKAGELIARLDAEPYRRELEEASAQLASAQAKLEMVEAGYRQEEVHKARAAVAEAEATLVNLDRNFVRRKELLAQKVSSQQEADDARAARDQAQARLHAARAALALQEAGFRPQEIAQARADVAKAEAALASAKLRLSDTELKAPSDGVVMTRAYEKGAILPTGATLFTISLTDPVWVRAYVSETRLGNVHSGMKVAVTTDSHPDNPYEGQIGYISPQAEFTPKSVETPELRTSLVYRLRVVISNAREDLRQGIPVTVHLPPNK